MAASSDRYGLEQRALSLDDAPLLVALSDAAGWNQTEADWRLMLGIGEGFGLWQKETPVGSAMILPYGSAFAWLSMVLVAETWRRQGLASRLTEACLTKAQALGLSVRLDATDAGRAVYRRFGFTDQYTFTRFAADQANVNETATLGPRAITDEDMDAVVAFEADSFGVNRKAVLVALRRRSPGNAFVSDVGGVTGGIVLARDGRRALQLGPLVANDTSTATALAAAALRDVREPVFIDAVDKRPDFESWLAQVGFAPQRQFTRMSLGEQAFAPGPTSFAVAGPEFG